MITPQELIIMDGNAPAINITLDPENKVGGHQFFMLENEDGTGIYVTLKMLQDFVTAACQLSNGLASRKVEYTKND
jgi:hypothetical protein